MCVISQKPNQNGFALLNTLIFILFMGLMGITLVTLVMADSRMQRINIHESRAFYAAQSGVEYALRGLLEASGKHNIASLHNYSETIPTGKGTRAKITIRLLGLDSLLIESTGMSQGYARTLTKSLKYVDVSDYAVYASGNVKYVRTIPPGKIKGHAKNMPLFDYDELRNMARPTQYFPHNLIINHFFSFHRDVVFVERNLIFGKFNWINWGNFVVGGQTIINTSPWPFGLTFGNIYLPFGGSQFISKWQFFSRVLSGGLVVNGDVVGTTKKWWPYRFMVLHNKSRMRKFFRYSLNGGPLVIGPVTWTLEK